MKRNVKNKLVGKIYYGDRCFYLYAIKYKKKKKDINLDFNNLTSVLLEKNTKQNVYELAIIFIKKILKK